MKPVNGSDAVLVQWNYNILCHPLSMDIPLDWLEPVDDLRTRMAMGAISFDEYVASRHVRFRFKHWPMMDDVMKEIPGKNNYRGNIRNDLFGNVAYPYYFRQQNNGEETPLNAAYYHRLFKISTPDASGVFKRQCGFSDENLFIALTTARKVSGLDIERCNARRCNRWSQRWTYAIPLEIIFTTPVTKWNPYGIKYRGAASEHAGKRIYNGPSGRRTGEAGKLRAYNGINDKTFYLTPDEFFGDEVNTIPADTVNKPLYVLDNRGISMKVRASGHRIILPEIKGVGALRQRYPIFPIHEEGNPLWKEVEALKRMVLEPTHYQNMFYKDTVRRRDVKRAATDKSSGPYFVTTESSADVGSHEHHINVSDKQMKDLEAGELISVLTEEMNGHRHNMTLYKQGDKYMMGHCDYHTRCSDGHSRRVFLIS
jgi:hypothetical protein